MIVPALRVLLAWLAGSVVAYACASVAHTATILGGLGALGVDVGMHERVATTLGDLAGLWRYGAILGLSLGLGLTLGRAATRRSWREAHGVALAMLAGGLAVGAALVAMRLAFSFTPIASARGVAGFAGQCLAGAAGGLAFRTCLVRLPGRARRT